MGPAEGYASSALSSPGCYSLFPEVSRVLAHVQDWAGHSGVTSLLLICDEVTIWMAHGGDCWDQSSWSTGDQIRMVQDVKG